MKRDFLPVSRLKEIEYFVTSGRFSFGKKHERISEKESYSNSETFQLKAAYYMPYQSIYEDIQNNTKDENQFIEELCEKYNQPKNVIVRRLQDVRRIIKAEKKK